MDRRRLLFTTLAMEREAVLDRFFDDIKVKVVSSEKDGWSELRIGSPFGPYYLNYVSEYWNIFLPRPKFYFFNARSIYPFF
jgi:hypothetical protein